jgi:hypothetical protein
MHTTPRFSIDDATIESQACAICGDQALRVAHLQKLPDYISCGSCGSVFVMEEGGDRVMYGKIPAEYQQTSELALRKWVMLETVREHAMSERPEAPPSEEATEQPPEPMPEAEEMAEAAAQMPAVETVSEGLSEEIFEEPEMSASRFQALLQSGEEAPPSTAAEEGQPMTGAPDVARWEKLAEEFEMPEPAAAPPAVEPGMTEPAPTPTGTEPSESPAEPEPAIAEPQPAETMPPPSPGAPPSDDGVEPPAGTRYKVRINGYRLRIPKSTCAHCLRIPADRTLAIVAPAPPGAQRQVVRLNAPLCNTCFRRANARSPEASSARLRAHVISALIAFGLVAILLIIYALAPGVKLWESTGIGVLVLFLLAIVGYGVPAYILLGRASRLPPPDDALFVRSTLIVSPEADPPGMTFSWRNPGFADLFHESNSKVVAGPVVRVAEQIDTDEPEPSLPAEP